MVKKKEDVKKEFTNFAKKIAEIESLKQELNALNAKGFETEAKLIKSKLKDINAIPEIKKEINSLREKIIHSTPSRKNIENIPKLESEVKNLKKDFEEHTKPSKMKIDTGVGILVNSKYDDFIDEIKAELTQRLKAKEITIKNKLKANLKENKEIFAAKYANLINEFHKKYQEKVKERSEERRVGKECRSRWSPYH